MSIYSKQPTRKISLSTSTRAATALSFTQISQVHFLSGSWTIFFRLGLRRLISPNLITFIGLLILLSPFILTFTAFGWALNGQLIKERWLNFLAGFAILIYSTLDNADGKQARKTGNSSTLGMLFDHGCDCLVTGILCVISSHLLSIEAPFAALLTGFACLVFYLKICEQAATHRLDLGAVNPVDEGLPFIAALYFISGVIGNEIWTLESPVAGIKIRNLSIFTLVLVTVFFTLFSGYQVVKVKSLFWMLKKLSPFFFLCFVCTTVLLSPLPVATSHSKCLFVFFILLQARMCIGIMMSHVQGIDPPSYNVYPFILSCLMGLIGALSFFSKDLEYELSFAYFALFALSVLCSIIRLSHLHLNSFLFSG